MATVVQNIPINILSAAQHSKLVEPTLPNPNVYILMPHLKSVQKVVDRMKNVSENIKIEANMAGQLKLSVTTEIATISTFYRNCGHPQIGECSPYVFLENILSHLEYQRETILLRSAKILLRKPWLISKNLQDFCIVI